MRANEWMHHTSAPLWFSHPPSRLLPPTADGRQSHPAHLDSLQGVVGDGHASLHAVQPLHVLLNVHRRGCHRRQPREILSDWLEQHRQRLLTLPVITQRVGDSRHNADDVTRPEQRWTKGNGMLGLRCTDVRCLEGLSVTEFVRRAQTRPVVVLKVVPSQNLS